MSWINRWSRKLHRWGAIVIALPILLVIASGLLLQVKKQVPWVQPTTQRGGGGDPQQSLEQLLEIARNHPQCAVTGWGDVERIDIQPGRTLAKIQCKNRWELQVDMASGEILSSAYRRSDLIESLHDGTFFGDGAKLAIFLPNGLILFGLWLTGLYLWFLPILVKRRKARKVAASNP